MAGKIIVLRGLPGCGKSTKAKEILDANPKAIRLNKDTLREMLHFGGYNQRNERYIVELEYQLAEKFVAKEMTVVVDDTNLNSIHTDYYKSLAEEHGAQFEVVDMTTTPIYACIARDEIRRQKGERFVGEDNIRNMAYQFGILKHDKTYAIFDMDGTLTKLDHRRHLVKDVAEGTKPDWDKFFSLCHEDEPRPEVIQKMYEERAKGHEVIICSARPEYTTDKTVNIREMTEQWLKQNGGWDKDGPVYSRMIMRRYNDHRKDTIVKKEMLDKYLDKTKIAVVYDDRPSVIRMWRENGLTVEDVGNGEEF